MSEEIKRIIKECSCVDTFDYVITPQQRDTMLLAEYIKNLQQENQELKEQLDKATRVALSEQRWASKCEDRCINYQSVLDEIREYIESNKREASSHFNGKEYVFINYWLECDPNELLQILDKVESNG